MLQESDRSVLHVVEEQCAEDVIVEMRMVLAGAFTVRAVVHLAHARRHHLLPWGQSVLILDVAAITHTHKCARQISVHQQS